MIHPLEYSYTQFHIKYHPARVSFSNLLKILSIRWRFSRHPQYCPMPHGFWITDSRHPQLVCNSLWSPQDSFDFKTLIHLLSTIIPRYTSSFFRIFSFSRIFLFFCSIIVLFRIFLDLFRISNYFYKFSRFLINQSVNLLLIRNSDNFQENSWMQVAKAAVGRLSGCTCVHSHQWYTH